MARRQPSTEDRRKGWRDILHRRQWHRLGLDLDALPEKIYDVLWCEFLQDVSRVNNRTLKHRELWTRFDTRLEDALGPKEVSRLLQRKKSQT